MKRKSIICIIFALALLMGTGAAEAGSLTVTNTFTSGTTASAAQVNQNFTDVETAVNDNNTKIADLLSRIAVLEALLAAVTDDGTDFVITGRNVHVKSGCGSTDDTTGGCAGLSGKGNLIIGYDEDTGSDVKTGSHNLVIGPEHTYSSYGGLVAGYNNAIINASASVSGGAANTASGAVSSVSGGYNNTASGWRSSVSGGSINTASGTASSVLGGWSNTASGGGSSVSGGNGNISSAFDSSVSGGYGNTASGDYSSVSGGYGNTSSNSYCSVSGGYLNVASGSTSSVSGGDSNTASGGYSSVSGGRVNTAGDNWDTVSGGWSLDSTGNWDGATTNGSTIAFEHLP
jgi:hypothetical protein